MRDATVGALRGSSSTFSSSHTASVPFAFERNDGQHAAEIRFAARGPGYRVSMLDSAVAVTVARNGAAASRLTMHFGDASRAPSAEETLPGRANYFVGRDPNEWRTNIPMFERVRYTDAYKGIDFVFYGRDRQLEYDVVVAPAADPRAVRIGFDGAESLRVDDGALVIRTGGRELRYTKPVAFQTIAGERRLVSAEYQIAGEEVSFAVGEYDTAQPLVIDPVLIFSTFLGGSSYDEINDVAVDLAGNMYVAGRTWSDDFPVTGSRRTVFGSSVLFVTKFSPGGKSILYSTVVGTVRDTFGIAVDPAGNAYVTGSAFSRFPVTPGAYQTVFRGSDPNLEENSCLCDGFVLKLTPSGSALAYSTFLGGFGNEMEEGGDVAVDSGGSAYVVGDTDSQDFPTTSGAIDRRSGGGGMKGFLARLNPAGSALVFSTFLTASVQSAHGVAVNDGGDAFVTGWAGDGLRVTSGAVQAVPAGGADAYVMRLNKSGALKYATYLGGAGRDEGRAIAIDASDHAYVTGSIGSGGFPTTSGAYQACHGTYSDSDDAFVAKLSPAGTSLSYSTCVGGSEPDVGRGIDVDIHGNATVVGLTLSSDFPHTGDASAFHGGTFDGFMTTLRADGKGISYSSAFGGSENDLAQSIRVDNAARRTVVGNTYSIGFSPMHWPMFPFHAGCNPGTCNDGFIVQFGNTSVGNRGGDDIVLYAGKATELSGTWRRVEDASAASGARLEHPDQGGAKITSPLAAPPDYFEMTAYVEIGVPYSVWVRGKAANNSTSNDSVYVQFSNAAAGNGAPAYGIGTSSAIPIVLEECGGCGLRGWAWQDGGYGTKAPGPQVATFTSGTITVRVQAREDGISLDQIVLAPMPGPYWNASPGYQKDDTIVLSEYAGNPYRYVTPKDIVLYPGTDAPSLHGAWTIVPDATAAGGSRVVHPDAGAPKINTALTSPTHFFDLSFDVVPGVQYSLWIRGKAQNDFWGNDSVFVQFSGSTNDDERMWTIGTPSALEVNLEACGGCGLKGWGWQDTLWGTAPPGGAAIYFNDGHQTMRVQTREDGLSIDQIVLSPNTYIDRAPGAAKNDTTIVRR